MEMSLMINKRCVAIVLAMGFIISISIDNVLGQDKYSQDLAAKELANTYQDSLSIPGSSQPIDQEYAPPKAIVTLDPSEIIDQEYAPPLDDVTGMVSPTAIDAVLHRPPSLSLWIHGPTAWNQYAQIPYDPEGTNLELVAFYENVDQGSRGKLLEIYSSSPYTQVDPSIYTKGNYKITDYFFSPGYSQIPWTPTSGNPGYTQMPRTSPIGDGLFSDDIPGFYYLMCTVNDRDGYVILSSNIVTINVVGAVQTRYLETYPVVRI
jgi:hypothetical protein